VRPGIFWLSALFFLEGLAIITAFQIISPIECRATEIDQACKALRSIFVSTLCVMAGFVIFMCARQKAWQRFSNMMQESSSWNIWTVLHGTGLTIIFTPLVIIPRSDLNQEFVYVFILLLVGAALTTLGGLFWVLRPHLWWKWLKFEKFMPALIILLAAMIPYLAMLIEPLWAIEFISSATFRGVVFLLSTLGHEVFVDPIRAWIGLPGFVVAVASSCSGIEGFALITGFMVLYAILFRNTLNKWAFWGVLWPIALVISWALNILRITVLILIGKYVSPDLAVNGFHSFAGWLLFTILGGGVLFAAQSVPALHRRTCKPQ
jgi:exosortase E/protease (VPEID-CTERM system)